MKVFISYRRKDSQPFADRIYDWLERAFGPGNTFKDVDSIQPGRDFRRILQDAVTRCDVLLAVIGPRWLGETDESGRRRVDDPGDWVRIEIETALTRDIRVIPLLVDGAPFPRGEDLPPSLQDLVYRHGIPVRPDPDFRHDVGRLIKYLRDDNRHPRHLLRKLILIFIITVFISIVTLVIVYRSQPVEAPRAPEREKAPKIKIDESELEYWGSGSNRAKTYGSVPGEEAVPRVACGRGRVLSPSGPASLPGPPPRPKVG